MDTTTNEPKEPNEQKEPNLFEDQNVKEIFFGFNEYYEAYLQIYNKHSLGLVEKKIYLKELLINIFKSRPEHDETTSISHLYYSYLFKRKNNIYPPLMNNKAIALKSYTSKMRDTLKTKFKEIGWQGKIII